MYLTNLNFNDSNGKVNLRTLADGITLLNNGTLNIYQGQALSFQISASDLDNLPLTYTLASGSLPSGITLSSSGLLSGTATTVTSYNFTVRVSNGHLSQTINYTGSVIPTIVTTTFTNENTTWTAPAGVTSISLSGQATTEAVQSGLGIPGPYAMTLGWWESGTGTNPSGWKKGNITWAQLYNIIVNNYNTCNAAIGVPGASLTLNDSQFVAVSSSSPYMVNPSLASASTAYTINHTSVTTLQPTQQIVSVSAIGVSGNQPDSLKTNNAAITQANMNTYTIAGWAFSVTISNAPDISFNNGAYRFGSTEQTNTVTVVPGTTYNVNAVGGYITISYSV